MEGTAVFNQLSQSEDDHDLVVCISPDGKSYWLNYSFESPMLSEQPPPQQQQLPLVRYCNSVRNLNGINQVCLSGYLMDLLVQKPTNLSWILQEILLTLPNIHLLTILLPFQQEQQGVASSHLKNLINILITNFRRKVFKPNDAKFGNKEIRLMDDERRLAIWIKDDSAYSSSSSEVPAEANAAAARATRGHSSSWPWLLDPLIKGILQELPTMHDLRLESINQQIHEDTFRTIVSTSNLQHLNIRNTSLGPFEVSALTNALQQQQSLSTDSDHRSSKRQRLSNSCGGTLTQLTHLNLEGIRIRQDQFSNLFEGLETTESTCYNTITTLTLRQVNIYPSYNGGKKEFWNIMFSFLRHNKKLRTFTLDRIRDSSGLEMTALMQGHNKRGEYFPFVAEGIESVLRNHNHTLSSIDIQQRQEQAMSIKICNKAVQELLLLNHFKVRPLIEDGVGTTTTTITKQYFLDMLIQVLEIKMEACFDNDDYDSDEFDHDDDDDDDDDEGGGDDGDGDDERTNSDASASETSDHGEGEDNEEEPELDADNDNHGATRGQQEEEEEDSYCFYFGSHNGYGTNRALVRCLFLLFRANPTLVSFLDGMPLGGGWEKAEAATEEEEALQPTI